MTIFTKLFPREPFDLGAAAAVTIGASGVLTLPGPGLYTVGAESGTTDALVQIIGLGVGNVVILQPKSTHTITVTDGTYLKLGGDLNFVMNNTADNITLKCESAGVCNEVLGGRVSNA